MFRGVNLKMVNSGSNVSVMGTTTENLKVKSAIYTPVHEKPKEKKEEVKSEIKIDHSLLVDSSTKSLKTEAYTYGGQYGGYNVSQITQGVNVANPLVTNRDYTRFLEGFISIDNPHLMRRKYKDMYYFDNISGTAVDLRAELPFSDFTISGIADPEVEKVYLECMEEMRPLQYLRRLMVDYFVYGAHAASLIWDDKRKIFLSPKPLDLDNCEFIVTPLLNDEPFINYKTDEWLKPFEKALENQDPRVLKYLEERPSLKTLLESLKEGVYSLPPETTLYIERNDLTVSPRATSSYYARAIKFYEYEKSIFRGTLDLSDKRLKSILHLIVGNDQIIPDADTMQEISNAFKTANLDPTDAIVTTPSYVQATELRSPTDFWRYDEIYDFVSRAKLSALGINEEFLSGSASYNNLETSLSVFLEQLKADRTMITDALFYKKIFPYIAEQNGFFADAQSKTNASVNMRDVKIDPFKGEKLNFMKKKNLLMPKIHWHKSLKPQGDKEYLDMLTFLQESGVPIPVRYLLTAANVDVEELVNHYKEEDNLMQLMKEYEEKREPSGSRGDFNRYFREGKDSSFEEVDPFEETLDDSPKEATSPVESARLKQLGLKVRGKLGQYNSNKIQELYGPRTFMQNGKVKYLKGDEAASANGKFNKNYSKVLANNNEMEIKKENDSYFKFKEENGTKKII